MRKAYCITCEKVGTIIKYYRDDPVLDCGHVKRLADLDDKKIVQDVYNRIQQFVREGMTGVQAAKAVREQDLKIYRQIIS